MSIFNKIISLSKQIAASKLIDEPSEALKNSEIFNETDKNYIIKNLTDKSLIEERLSLAKQINKKADWKKVKSKINVPVRKLYWRYAAVAAVIVGALTSSRIFLNIPPVNTPIIVNNNINNIKSGTDKAILTLENGEEVALEKGTNLKTQDATSNGKEIVYETKKRNTKEVAYNYLTIPRGGQFFIKLSDGTEVWLNSESKLKYPVSFIDGAIRKVELVYGEAYFEVSPSTEHSGTKFMVVHNEHEIEVLGTEFNIKAYQDETNIITTLVHGTVNINYQGEKYLLNPNQQSNLDRTTNEILISKVNVDNDILWRKGVFSFNDKSLNEIMKVLSRWYDVDVEFATEELGNVRFNGVLNKNQQLEEILQTIQTTNYINTYEIKNKKITLK